MTYEKSCGVVIYRKNEKALEYLIVKSLVNGHWVFTKGHQEVHETDIETAQREVKEEVNLDVCLIDDFKEAIEYQVGTSTSKQVVYFLGESFNQHVKVQAEEIKSIKWGTYDEIHDLLTHTSNKQVLKKANDYLQRII